MIGKMLASVIVFAYSGACLSWLKAGHYFEKLKKKEAQLANA
jgi:hypothetical protein